jgi:integrase/recombinase XerC
LGRPKKQNREPFWFADRQAWYVKVGTTAQRLSPDKDEAWRLWHEMMAKPPEARQKPRAASMQAVEILDLFLDWCQKNRAETTYNWHKHFCQMLAVTLPSPLPVADLKPYHLTLILSEHADWSNNTRRNFVTAVQRAMNWGVDEGLIERSPIARMKKPGIEARDLAISPTLYAEVIEAIKEPNFRLLLAFAWESGVRPQEIRAIEARHIDFALKRIVFPPKESKGKKRHRVVYLTDAGIEILKPLVEKHPHGEVFRNSENAAWNKNSINCAFCRLQKKIGRKLHLGAWRKGYTTEAIKAGVDVSTLAGLLGHHDGRMISTTYSKVTQDQEHMARMAEKAKKPTGS